MTIMTSDLTYKEIISRMPTEDFRQWQEWLNDKAICENKECNRCKYYIEQYEQRVLKKGQKTIEKKSEKEN